MDQQTELRSLIEEDYTFEGDSFCLGAAMLGEQTLTGCHVNVPMKTLNRHGLISGATGTGKTKTLQVFAENLSDNGIPVMLMDIKGDLSGLAKASPGHRKIDERHELIGLPFTAKPFPVEILSLSEQDGLRLRATISEFGPILLSRILQLNDTQEGVLAILFQYCDDNALPLLDLKDLKKVLQYATSDGKSALEADYGRISVASVGAIMRKLIALEQQGADLFFGERSFDVRDLCRLDELGRGYLSVIRLTDIQDKPKLFSTFMLQLLAEIYSSFPELGDTDRPELVIFIDEAHLVFENASQTLLDQLESMVKLIRSKGVGLFFVTQNPKDIPQDILSQLGLKVQHALRAFTAKDRKAIKLAAENYPLSPFYDTARELTELGIGEALVTTLSEKGTPLALAKTMLRAPMSRMDILTSSELKELIEGSKLADKYNEPIDRQSAFEMLEAKISQTKEVARRSGSTRKSQGNQETDLLKPILKVVTSAAFVRGVFGILNKYIK